MTAMQQLLERLDGRSCWKSKYLRDRLLRLEALVEVCPLEVESQLEEIRQQIQELPVDVGLAVKSPLSKFYEALDPQLDDLTRRQDRELQEALEAGKSSSETWALLFAHATPKEQSDFEIPSVGKEPKGRVQRTKLIFRALHLLALKQKAGHQDLLALRRELYKAVDSSKGASKALSSLVDRLEREKLV